MKGCLVWLAAAALAACFEPTYPTELACSATGTCPPGQTCDRGINRCRVGVSIDAPVSQPDAATACTLFPQSGCTNGFKCTLDANDHTKTLCVAQGPVGVGGACAGLGSTDNCTSGSICVAGGCHALCSTSPDSCGTEICANFDAAFSACTPRCDVLAPGCPQLGGVAATCYLGDIGSGQCAVPHNDLAVGSPCTFFNDCIVGAGCIANVCRRLCDYGAHPDQMAPTCQPGELCRVIRDTYGSCK